MKILLTHRYFWPDTTPYALILRAIAEGLAEAGHDVQVLASQPSYRRSSSQHRSAKMEQLGAIQVHRYRVFANEKNNILRRLANVFLHCFAVFFAILRQRPDVVTAATFPPVIAAWTVSLAARMTGAKFIYHMQDIHPEVSALNNGWLGRGPQMRLLRWLDNQSLRRASAIIVLSQDMADTLNRRGLKKDLPIHIINNLSLDLFDTQDLPPAEFRKPEGRRRIIFAGNLGRFQNLPAVTEGIARCFEDHPDLELMFLGDGLAEAELKATWGNHPQVKFGPFLPFSQARVLIEEADIGLVSLMQGIFQVAYPSKVLTYLDLSVPILAAVEYNSDLARTITNFGLGAVPVETAPHAIMQAAQTLLNAPVERDHIRSWFAEHASQEVVIARWKTMISTLLSSA